MEKLLKMKETKLIESKRGENDEHFKKIYYAKFKAK